MSTYIEDLEFPFRYRSLVDDSEQDGFQLRANLWETLATWSSGTRAIVDGAQAVELPGGAVVTLGDYAMFDGINYTVESGDEFLRRWWPVGRTED